MKVLDPLQRLFLTFGRLAPRFFLDHLEILQPSLIPNIKSSSASIDENIRSEKAKAIVPVEKYKIMNAPRIVTGKTKENKFNCGADLVIIPAETLIIRIIYSQK